MVPFPLPLSPLIPRLIADNNRGSPGPQPGGFEGGSINRDGAWRSHLPSRSCRLPRPPAGLRSAALGPSPSWGGPIACRTSPALPPTQCLSGPVPGPAENGGGLSRSRGGGIAVKAWNSRGGNPRVPLASPMRRRKTKDGSWRNSQRLCKGHTPNR